MFFEKERIGRVLKDLDKLIYSNEQGITDICYKQGDYKSIEAVEADEQSWIKFNEKDTWGGKDQRFWFRAKYMLPESYRDKKFILSITTGLEDQWDAVNPQFLLYINNRVKQGIDMNHRIVHIEWDEIHNGVLKLDLHAYAGMQDRDVKLELKLSQIDGLVDEIYYDISVPYEATILLEDTSNNYIYNIKHLNNAVNLLELNEVRHGGFHKSILAAKAYLNEHIYGLEEKHHGPTVTCVGHTHIDVAWLWTIRQTREKVARSYSTVLELMKDYPEYTFMSSQPQLFKFLKEDHPSIYEAVREKIKDGRWEVEGGMWLEADCNLSSGESLIRHLLYGKKFMRDEFGVESKVLWLPDVFGYSHVLPQLLKKMNMDYFITTKISWSEYNKMPYDSFWWQGLDGSQVLTHFITCMDYEKSKEGKQQTVYEGEIKPSQIMGAWDRYQQKDINQNVLISYGHGDGGGGPTRKMLENGRRISKGIQGCPKIHMGKTLEFMNTLERQLSNEKKVPKWVGELYLEYHRGTYTTVAKNKWYNRKSENLYLDLEGIGILCEQMGLRQYPNTIIKEGWDKILLNQFHDIIPGTSIKEVYDESHKQYEKILKEGHEEMSCALNTILECHRINENQVIVYNQLSFIRSGIVEFMYDINTSAVQCESRMVEKSNKSLILVDNNGVECNTQWSKGGFTAFIEDMPSKGYKIFEVKETHQSDMELIKYRHIKNLTQITTEYYDVEIDALGNISKLFDKEAERHVLKEHEVGNEFIVFDDRPHKWEAWDINIHYQEKFWKVDQLESIELVENGPIRAVIEVTKRFRKSKIVQQIIFIKGSRVIEFDSKITWEERNTLLKVAFPIAMNCDKATYDMQFGNVERNTHWNTSWDVAKFEVCAHKWADLSEAGYGVSLLNDSKYGYDIKEGVMRLSLIKSPTWPYKDSDIGSHQFRYGLYPHLEHWKSSDLIEEGYKFNNLLYGQGGIKGKDGMAQNLYSSEVKRLDEDKSLDGNKKSLEKSFMSIDKSHIICETIKKSECGNYVIIRCYECINRRTKAVISFDKEILAICETDLEEQPTLELDYELGQVELKFLPYEIKTLRVKFKEVNKCCLNQ